MKRKKIAFIISILALLAVSNGSILRAGDLTPLEKERIQKLVFVERNLQRINEQDGYWVVPLLVDFFSGASQKDLNKKRLRADVVNQFAKNGRKLFTSEKTWRDIGSDYIINISEGIIPKGVNIVTPTLRVMKDIEKKVGDDLFKLRNIDKNQIELSKIRSDLIKLAPYILDVISEYLVSNPDRLAEFNAVAPSLPLYPLDVNQDPIEALKLIPVNDENSPVRQDIKKIIEAVVKNGGDLEKTIDDLKDLSKESFDTLQSFFEKHKLDTDKLNTSVEDIDREIRGLADRIEKEANDSKEKEKLELELKIKETGRAQLEQDYQSNLQETQSGVNLFAGIVGLVNPKLGTVISATGNSFIAIGETIRKFNLEGMKFTLAFNLFGAINFLVGSLQDNASEEQHKEVMGALRVLSQQVTDLRNEMNSWFSQLDSEVKVAINLLYDVLDKVSKGNMAVSYQLATVESKLVHLGLQAFEGDKEGVNARSDFYMALDDAFGPGSKLLGEEFPSIEISSLSDKFSYYARYGAFIPTVSGATLNGKDGDSIRKILQDYRIDVIFGYLNTVAKENLGVSFSELPNLDEWLKAVEALTLLYTIRPENTIDQSELTAINKRGEEIQSIVKEFGKKDFLLRAANNYKARLGNVYDEVRNVLENKADDFLNEKRRNVVLPALVENGFEVTYPYWLNSYKEGSTPGSPIINAIYLDEIRLIPHWHVKVEKTGTIGHEGDVKTRFDSNTVIQTNGIYTITMEVELEVFDVANIAVPRDEAERPDDQPDVLLGESLGIISKMKWVKEGIEETDADNMDEIVNLLRQHWNGPSNNWAQWFNIRNMNVRNEFERHSIKTIDEVTFNKTLANIKTNSDVLKNYKAQMLGSELVNIYKIAGSPLSSSLEELDVSKMVMELFLEIGRPNLVRENEGLRQLLNCEPLNVVQSNKDLPPILGCKALADSKDILGIIFLNTLREKDGKVLQAMNLDEVGFWNIPERSLALDHIIESLSDNEESLKGLPIVDEYLERLNTLKR